MERDSWQVSLIQKLVFDSPFLIISGVFPPNNTCNLVVTMDCIVPIPHFSRGRHRTLGNPIEFGFHNFESLKHEVVLYLLVMIFW
jgi:hypothetical protein